MNTVDDALKEAVPMPVPVVSPPATDGLSAAYAAHDDAPKVKASIRFGLWVLLGLLLLNVALWFTHTSTRAVWGSSSESAVQANMAAEKIGNPSLSKTKTSAPPVTPPVPTAATPPPAPVLEKTACMVWSFSNNTDAKRADSRLAEQAWGGYTTELADEASTHMAFVGPFSTQAQAQAMLKKIAALKIKDYSLLPSNSIALGVVATREGAQQLQQQLINRGLKDVQLIERQGKIKRKRYRFEQMAPSSMQALRQLVDGVGTLTECGKP
jgi:cell division septation protein DedD